MLRLRWGSDWRNTQPNGCADSNADGRTNPSADGCTDSNADGRADSNADSHALRIADSSANVYSDSRTRSGAITSADSGAVSFADGDSWRPDRDTDDIYAHGYANPGADAWAIDGANLSVGVPHSVGISHPQ